MEEEDIVAAEGTLSDCVIEASGLPYRKCRKGADISKYSSVFTQKHELHPYSMTLV
jgi:hypothetical protein